MEVGGAGAPRFGPRRRPLTLRLFQEESTATAAVPARGLGAGRIVADRRGRDKTARAAAIEDGGGASAAGGPAPPQFGVA